MGGCWGGGFEGKGWGEMTNDEIRLRLGSGRNDESNPE
jgi:hypothetical protein